MVVIWGCGGPVMPELQDLGRDVHTGKTLDIIENDIDPLTEVDGIGPGRTEKTKLAWDEQKAIRKEMIFLQEHDVSCTYAIKIYKEYGDRAIEVVSDNPYRLAHDMLPPYRVRSKMPYPGPVFIGFDSPTPNHPTESPG